MQQRMKTHPLTEEQIAQLLARAQIGSLATVASDGSPYVTPVHFVHSDGMVYVHGLPKGQKIDNLKVNSRVCMTVYEMDSLLLDPDGKPCGTNTKYRSVILSGQAALLEDIQTKQNILRLIVEKYTPHLAETPMPDNMVRGTAVIAITVKSISGKYYG